MRESCEHSSDYLYRAPVFSIVKAMKMREISVVRRPDDPEARILEIPVDTEDLRTALGPEFSPGTPVSCDKCLGNCWGFDELPPDELPRH
jgi:hypothetical protein